MKKRSSLWLATACYAFLSVITAFHGSALANASDISREKTFVLGRITENPRKHHAAMEEMGGYILAHLKDLGYEAVDVVMVKDIDEMVPLMSEGKVDALSETPFAAVRLIDEAGAEAFLREWKKGVASYRSVFFTAKDSGIESLAGLRGKRIAFEDPGSTSAFLLPLAMLRLAGVDAVELASIDEQPPADKAGYVFTRDEMTQLMWVARDTADAGAFSNLNWADHQGTKVVQDKLKLIHEGEPVMRSIFVVRQNLSEAVKSRIAQTLLSMTDDEDGRRVLTQYNEVKKYDQPNAGEIAQSLASVRRMTRVLHDIIE